MSIFNTLLSICINNYLIYLTIEKLMDLIFGNI